MSRRINVDVCSEVLSLAACDLGDQAMSKAPKRGFYGVGLPKVEPLCFDVGWESLGNGTYRRVSPRNHYCLQQLKEAYRFWLNDPDCIEYPVEEYFLLECTDRFGGAIISVNGQYQILSTHKDCIGCAAGEWKLTNSSTIDFGYTHGDPPHGSCVEGEGTIVHSFQTSNGVEIHTYECGGTVVETYDVGVELNWDQETAEFGDERSFTVVVTNYDSAVGDVEVDITSAFTPNSYISTHGDLTNGVWTIGALSNLETATLEVFVTVDSNDTATAVVSIGEVDSNPINNSSSDFIFCNPPPLEPELMVVVSGYYASEENTLVLSDNANKLDSASIVIINPTGAAIPAGSAFEITLGNYLSYNDFNNGLSNYNLEDFFNNYSPWIRLENNLGSIIDLNPGDYSVVGDILTIGVEIPQNYRVVSDISLIFTGNIPIVDTLPFESLSADITINGTTSSFYVYEKIISSLNYVTYGGSPQTVSAYMYLEEENTTALSQLAWDQNVVVWIKITSTTQVSFSSDFLYWGYISHSVEIQGGPIPEDPGPGDLTVTNDGSFTWVGDSDTSKTLSIRMVVGGNPTQSLHPGRISFYDSNLNIRMGTNLYGTNISGGL